MQRIALTFSILLWFLHKTIIEIKDPRGTSNATKYKVSDGMLAAFSMFLMQCESFLEHQTTNAE